MTLTVVICRCSSISTLLQIQQSKVALSIALCKIRTKNLHSIPSLFIKQILLTTAHRAPSFAMSTSTLPPSLIEFLRKSYPSAISPTTTEAEIPHSSREIFPESSYTETEKIEISQWLTTSARLATPDEDEAKHAGRLGSLNIHLSTRTTLLGTKPSVADVALFYRLAPAVKSWSAEERTGEHGYHNIVRFIDFVQNAPLFKLSLDAGEKVDIDVDDVKFAHKPLDPKEEKERRKREKATVTGSVPGPKSQVLPVGKGKEQAKEKDEDQKPAQDLPKSASDVPAPSSSKPKKEKKEKAPKAPKAPAAETLLSPCLIDLRVGHILRAIPHPNADSLYVSTIDCGDPPDAPNTNLDEMTGLTVRTVCSGLNGLIPLADLQDRLIVAVCNLKPVTMRGVKSAAMVLAASPRLRPEEEDTHKGPVELVNPPKDAKAGERVYFEGWEGESEGQLNPKKKVWETLQPGFTTTGRLEVGFDASVVEGLKKVDAAETSEQQGTAVAKLRTKGGVCSVTTLKEAVVR